MEIYDYAIIGAGPAGILAAAKILADRPLAKILWLDPEFKVGKFGTTFAEHSGIPGNTTKASYLIVFNEIYRLLPYLKRSVHLNFDFTENHNTPSLTDAAKPLQEISDELGKFIPQIQALVHGIIFNKLESGYSIFSSTITYKTKNIIVATGAIPKTLNIDSKKRIIPTEVAFIKEKLQEYFVKNQHEPLEKILVIGSSHSAALACMHLRSLGKHVMQWMTKDFLFAYKKGGHTVYDNTGLKGTVAAYVKNILKTPDPMWERYLSKEQPIEAFDELVQLADAVIYAFGYERSNSFLIDFKPLAAIQYNPETCQLLQDNGKPYPGLIGLGIGFPERVKTPLDTYEYAVGVEKFWTTINKQCNNLLNLEKKNISERFSIFKKCPHILRHYILNQAPKL